MCEGEERSDEPKDGMLFLLSLRISVLLSLFAVVSVQASFSPCPNSPRNAARRTPGRTPSGGTTPESVLRRISPRCRSPRLWWWSKEIAKDSSETRFVSYVGMTEYCDELKVLS